MEVISVFQYHLYINFRISKEYYTEKAGKGKENLLSKDSYKESS